MRGGGLTDREHSLLVSIAKAQLVLLEDAQSRLSAEFAGTSRPADVLNKQARAIGRAEGNLEYDLRLLGEFDNG